MPPASPPTGFLVVHGNRLEDLRDLVIEVIRSAPLPPLVPETFLVQSNGMKHWLQQALADDAAFGICAATDIDLPSRFLWRAYRAVLGREVVPTQLVFDKEALTWRLLRMLPACVAADPRLYAPLHHYLENDPDGRRAWQLAQQVADVLDGYQQYRADWLDAWEQGRDLLDEAHEVPAAQRWQPALWRALRLDVGARHENTSRAAVHRSFIRAMRAQEGRRTDRIPPRLFVFGISALPMQSVEALAELGRVCQVVVAVQNPCRFYWGDIVEGRHLLRQFARRRQAPRADLELHAEAPPLLASLGRQGRDYLHLIDEFDQTVDRTQLLPRVDCFADPREDCPNDRPPSRLARLQSAILNLEPLPPRPEAIREDDSIQFVQAHSAQREVEVLHDHLLALLDADDALKPSDIMVMVPDMADFVSHIQAVFGRFDREHARHLPFSVADTSPRSQPLVQALERLLHLPDSRLPLTEWLSLFEIAAVRRRFGLTDADVKALHSALTRATVRWGLDGPHRAAHGVPQGLPTLAQNTWGFGLERLLLGYAVPDSVPWQDVLPVSGGTGLAAQRVGGLAAWLDAMRVTLEALREPQSPREWTLRLAALLDRFFDAQGEEDTDRLLQRLREQLLQWQALCETAAFDQAVTLLVVREQWLASIEGDGLQQRFFGGGVQFATLMPMRSIPFKVVCLLGMNDGAYPRPASPRDFDLMLEESRPGDRSRRDDDRYLFLEALLSARQKLYVSWVGRRVTDNAQLPPSVVVGQLRDELARRFAVLQEPRLQPLQPFSRQYFGRTAPGEAQFVTYDTDWQAVDAATLRDRVAASGPARLPLPEAITLQDLQRFLKQPVETFWRQRLQVRFEELDEALDEDEPFDLDPLEEHQAKSIFIEDRLGAGEAEARRRLRLSGRLPLGAAGDRVLEDLARDAETLIRRAQPWRDAWTPSQDAPAVDLDVDGLHVHGVVTGLRRKAAQWLQLEMQPGAVTKASRPRFHKFVAAWVVQVCLEAAGHDVRTVFCGPDEALQASTLGADEARAQLKEWVAAFREAWQAPLPVACRTAFEKLVPTGKRDAADRLEEAFDGDHRGHGDRPFSAYLRRSFQGYADVADGIERWAEPLYGRLARALPVGKPVADPEDSEASAGEDAA
jgi:exodeoxyribonuclease V gamma subunit